MRRTLISILLFSLVVLLLAFYLQGAPLTTGAQSVQFAAARAASGQDPRYAVLQAGRQGRAPAHAAAAAAPVVRLGPAATIVGNGTPGSCTSFALQTALAGGGEIGFNCGAAPLSLPGGPYTIAAPTTIDGGGLVTLDGENAHRIFEVAAGVPLTLTNLALSGGASAGGSGGAVWNQGRLALRGGLYTNNSASGGVGGAIFNDGGTLDVKVGPLNSPWYNPTFSQNQAVSGGAIAGTGSLAISGAVFEQNAATAGEGGALQLLGGASAALYNITARYNSATDGGGAFAFSAASSATLDFIDIFYNTVSGPAAGGGGIENAGTLSARLLWLDSNAAFQGGAVYNQGTFSPLEQSTLSNNSAAAGGGVYTSGALLLENATISANTAGGGGGLYNAGGSSTVRFSTWKNNSADSGGTLDANQGDVTLYASLFAENTCVTTGGTLTSQGYNIQPGTSCSLDNPNDRPDQDPLLAELDNYGGWQYTHALLYGSPAIDLAPAAGCPPFDQRETARPSGLYCDSGALEMAGAPPTPTPLPTPTATPVPAPANPNFIVIGMEINQGIQDMSNDVPLVSQKRTLVRVYVRNLNPVNTGPLIYVPWATLSYTNFTYTNVVYPRNNPHINNYTGTFSRGARNTDVYEFEIPTYDLSSYVLFHFELNPVYLHTKPVRMVRDVTETDYTDNTLDKFYTFSAVSSMNLRVLDVPYTINNTTYLPTALDHQRLEDWLHNAYPISALNIIYSPYPTTFTTQPTTNEMLDLVAFYRNLLRPPDNEHWYAMVSDVGFPCVNRATSFNSPDCFMRGLASGKSAVGPAGTYNWGWDNDNSYADWYGGHEVAHTYGRAHPQERSGGPNPPNCGHSPDDPVKHYANLSISPLLTGTGAIWGWDWHVAGADNYLDPATWVDMMGYCKFQWIADYTYNAIRDQLNSGSDLRSPEAAVQADAMLVVGSLPALTDTVSLMPIQVLPNVTLPITPTLGNYVIVQYDSLGVKLSSHGFNLPASRPLTDTLESDGRHFAELVPVAPGVKKVTIERANGAQLYSIQAGMGAPQVAVSAPTAGSPRPGDLTVSWSASDPDSDPLNFSVAYSKDSGATWQTGAVNITSTQAVFSLALLPAGSSALFRVYASDGVHSSYGDSPTFAVPNHLPSLDLIAPQAGLTIVPTDTLELRASAADIDLGSVPGSAITWRSNRDGVLAHGPLAVITGLSAGSHIISASVDDGQGGVASKSVLVTVVKFREDLPPPASGWQVDPSIIVLDQTAWQLSAQIGIANRAGSSAPLNWTVSTDAAWLVLDAASGAAPSSLGVRLDPAGLADGVHYATLTFTSPDLSGVYKVRVAAVVGKGRLYVPLLTHK